MKSRLLFFLSALCMTFIINAQITSVGLIGSATPGGWDADTPMVKVTDSTWTLDLTLVAGEAKFRANGAWTINWGASDFPTGTGVQEGPNVPVLPGDYTVNFNSSSGAYSFAVKSDIGIIGSATPGGWDNDTNMYIDPSDTNKYYITLPLTVGEAKFRQGDAWAINWGANTFPTGVGTQDGPNIPISAAGEYTINFNKSTGDYSFEIPPAFTSIGVIGSATPGGWDNDTDLTQSITNANVWIGDMTLSVGELKFRADRAWDLNWGGTAFPTGIATVGGDNLPVPEAGRYVLWFNTETLEYGFIKVDITTVGIIGSATPGGWDTDTDMIQDSADVNIWRININLTNGEAKFRINDAWDVNWGSTTFPNGTGVQNGPNIPILFGNYDVTFNSLTGDYNFQVNSDIGIIGSATPGGWDNDTDMYQDATDSSKYFITLDLVGGEAKFRQNNAWTINWGDTAFPSGVGTQDGPNIPIAAAGKYRIDFNKATGAYKFAEVVDFTSIAVIGSATAGGWDNETPLTKDAGNPDLWKGVVTLVEGELKFRANNAWDINWGGTDFPVGIGEFNSASNIPVLADQAGEYQVSFNTITLEYNFLLIRSYESIGIIGDATPGGWDNETKMTQDANDKSIWRLRVELVDGEAKFRADNDWAINWGSGDFPTGVGEQDGANIPVVAGDYKITFNSITGEYVFEAVVEYDKISLVGNAGPFGEWPGDDDSRDTYLDKDPNDPNHWTLASVVLRDTPANGGIKFRAEAAWTINWGSPDFPVGIGTQNGANIVCTAGTYKIDFKSDTGEYAFGEPSSTYDLLSSDVIKLFPNPAKDVLNIEVNTDALQGKVSATLFNVKGEQIASQLININGSAKINISGFQSGNYILRISNDKNLVAKSVVIIK